jgi:drug/metabolite transporter (DMT)-like permease
MLCITGATAAFITNDALVKLVGYRAPVGEVIFVRGLFAAFLIGCAVLVMGHARSLGALVHPLVLLRGVLEGLSVALFISALMHMPIAELSTISLLSPLVITMLSVLLFGEKVGWRRWSAIVVGFVGTLIVVRPSPAAFNMWALVGVACAFTGASRDLVTRRLSGAIPALVIALSASTAVAATGLVMGFWEEWRPLSLQDVGLLAIAGGFLAVGNLLLVVAFRGVDISAVVPFRYTMLLWAAIAGFFVFGEVPDLPAFAGAALIVASGLYTLRRERVRGVVVARSPDA